jgi:hypothetical protein
MDRIFASVLLCTLPLVVLAFATACGGHSNQIGTCLACPEEQAVYATTNSGQVLTFPFPLGTQLVHRTIELPNPVTQPIAVIFNKLFGRL